MLVEPLHETPWTRTPEWWVNSPGPFIDIAFDLGVERFAFSEKISRFIPNMRLNPEKLLQATSRGRPWRAIIVEADNKGAKTLGKVAVEYSNVSWFERPVGVYPLWSGVTDDYDGLREMCSSFEPGKVIGRFFGHTVDMRIVEGQEKRVFVRSLSDRGNMEDWQRRMTEVSRIKADFPDVIFHFHGGKSIAHSLGVGVDAYDHWVRIGTKDGEPILMMPNGKRLYYKDRYSKDHRIWSDLIGRNPVKIFEEEDRKTKYRAVYEFNMLSFKWCNSNYDRVWTPSGQGGTATDEDFDFESSDATWRPKDDLVRLPARLRRERFDRWLCDVCSIAVSCPYARPGAVCIVEDSPTTDLVEKFKSRRASDITDGLAHLLQVNSDRLTRGLQYEIEKEKIDPNVSKLVDSLFDRGLQLARLRDPALAAQMSNGTKVSIGVSTQGGSATVLAASNPAELMAAVASMLEQQGIALEDATEEDVTRVLGAIEVESREA